jgi:hypothetical protein
VLQEVLARLDRTYQAVFRRVANGKKPGFPWFHGKDRYHSVTNKEYGNGARLENRKLVLSTIGRIAVRWSRPVAGSIRQHTAAYGSMRRQASGGGASGVHLAGLQRLWATHREAPVGAHPCRYDLRPHRPILDRDENAARTIV